MYINQKHEKAIRYLKDGNLKKSLVLLDRCIVDYPNNPVLYSDRGTLHLHFKNKEKALSDMNKAVQLQPDYSYRYASRAFVKDFFGDTDGAIEDYEKAIQLDPSDAVALNNLGVLMDKKGYKDAAKRNFKKADEYLNNSLSMKQKMGEWMENDLKNQPEGVPLESKNLTSKNTDSTEKKSVLHLFFGVFSNKKTFSEFVQFVQNGFKLKK